MGNDATVWQRRPGLVRVLALLLAFCLAGGARAESVEVITSPDRGDLQIDRPMLQAIYLMRVREWPDGKPVRVFVMPDSSDTHDRFTREKLGTYPYVLHRVWERMVFTGTGLAPETVRSEQEMRDKVKKTEGAIGYVLSRTRSAREPGPMAMAFHQEGPHAQP